ncbi:MAG: DUF4124 domain-containing protein [Gammaproteobacteria bacterium]
MRKWLILLSTILVTAASGAPAWTWVDADGQVHFSDRPEPGARQVELTGAQGFSAPAARSATATGAPPTATTPASYRTLNISSPAEQQTLWNIEAMLSVQIAVDPPLAPMHRLDLILDGQRRNLNTTNLRVTLPDVFRGVHTLQAVVIDASGAEVMRSPTRNFIVQQNSIQNPNSLLRRR